MVAVGSRWKGLRITSSIGLWYWLRLHNQQIRYLTTCFRIIAEIEQFIIMIQCSVVSKIRSDELVRGFDGFSSDKQDRQCTCARVTWCWGAFVQTFLTLKSIKYYILRVCVYSLSYSVWTADVLYYTGICGLSGTARFSTILKKDKIFGKKKFIKHKSCVLIPSTNCAWNTSHSAKS